MKKVFAIALGAALVLGLVACGGGSDAGSGKNGTYSAARSDEYAENNGNGFKDTLTVEYKDGVITSATFDSLNLATGAKKSELSDEEYPMDPPASQWIPELGQNIVSAGNAAGLDAISGATSASDSAKAMLEAIEKDGVEGETIIVD